MIGHLDQLSEPLHRTRTGYYDVLEVSPSATQAQIKTAYYKQSFAFHPDRNSGSEEATVRFSEISEAYMVLGNKSLRKKYDTGLLSLSDLVARAKPAGGASSGVSGEQQAGSSRSAAGAALRERVFDFDEFYKAHYSEQLQRQREIRVRKEEMLKKKQERAGEKKLGRMMEIGVGMLLVSAAGIILSLRQ
uniref:DnaJ heat shock protein family (Hsp40) member C30 n=1 Tax=Fundulus heteroclitus TaxID=8078 RepID=A0A3Q2QL94_FUNHE